MFSRNTDIIYADGPAIHPLQPPKPDIRVVMKEIEQAIDAFASGAGTVAKQTQTQLLADLTHSNDRTAWVYADPNPANNGVYRKIGAAGTGTWTRILPLPFSFIIASDAGVGEPNHIQATTSLPVSNSSLVWMNIAETNGAGPITVQFNGTGPTYTIKTNSGNDPQAGGLTAGMIVLGIASGGVFRLLNDQVSSSIVAAAEAALEQYEEIREMAETAIQPADLPETQLTVNKPLSSPRLLKDKLADLPFVEDWGAKGDGSNSDMASFQRAVQNSKIVFLRSTNYMLDGVLTIPRFTSMRGFSVANSDASNFVGSAKLLFSGSGGACIKYDESTLASHAVLEGFVLKDISNGGYNWLMDFKQAVQLCVRDVRMETSAMATGGLRGYKAAVNDPSWVNLLDRTMIHLPDNADGRVLDVDWSDSDVRGCQLTGGTGVIDRGIDVRYLANQIERSKYATLTLLKKTNQKLTVVVANKFDKYATHGVVVDASQDTTLTAFRDFAAVINSNTFTGGDPVTNAQATSDIYYYNPGSDVYNAPSAGPNIHRLGAASHYNFDISKWRNITFLGGVGATANARPYGIDDKVMSVHPKGIVVAEGIVAARGAETIFGQPNVSAFFGNSTTGEAGAAFGFDGTDVLIGATKNSGGGDRGMAFMVGGQKVFRITAARDFIQLFADVVVSLGTAAARFANVFARNFRPGSGAPIWTSGAGTPEGATTAPPGSFYTDETNGVAYVKKSGTGNTGWKLVTQAA